MDLSDPHTLELFLEVYGTLPRAGPGGDEHTTRAWGWCPGQPRAPCSMWAAGPGPRPYVSPVLYQTRGSSRWT
jgi:hypothetical protein